MTIRRAPFSWRTSVGSGWGVHAGTKESYQAGAADAPAEFANTLTLSSTAAPGSYVARLTVRDHVGQDLKTHEVRFDLP